MLVYGGNLGKPQGIPYIIKCLEKLKDNKGVHFLIVGDGTEFSKMEEYVSTKKPYNLTLLKRLPIEDYDKMITACDIGLIFLDHRFTIPNFPSRILSYMQAELPIIASTDPNSDIGQIIVREGFGWWCKSDSVESFFELVTNLPKSINKEKENAKNFLRANYTSSIAYKIIIDSVSELKVNNHRYKEKSSEI